MTIQFNTGHHVNGSTAVTDPLSAVIADDLKRFSEYITRVEVHLTDENSHKEGPNDKRCVLEARLEGMQPIAVTNHAATRDAAVTGALDKLKSSLDSAIGKRRNH